MRRGTRSEHNLWPPHYCVTWPELCTYSEGIPLPISVHTAHPFCTHLWRVCCMYAFYFIYFIACVRRRRAAAARPAAPYPSLCIPSLYAPVVCVLHAGGAQRRGLLPRRQDLELRATAAAQQGLLNALHQRSDAPQPGPLSAPASGVVGPGSL